MILEDLLSEDQSLRISVLLSLQHSLLGEVTPDLRCVNVGWDENEISGKFYYDSKISEEILERVSEIETLVMAGFPNHHVRFKALHHSGDLPLDPMECVYLRAE